MTVPSAVSKLVKQVVAGVKKQLPAKQLPLIATFIQQFFADVTEDDIINRPVASLCQSIVAHWRLMWQRKLGECKVAVFNPEPQDDWNCLATIITIIHDDMPFLVDSLQMELDRLGIAVRNIIHLGGIKVNRDAKGCITAIAPIQSTQNYPLIEAPIYIEVAHQTDPKTLKNIKANIERVLQDVRNTVGDWQKMQQEMQAAIAEIEESASFFAPGEYEETQAFLHWLLNNNFTFLGYRNYEVITAHGKNGLHLIRNSSLGLLRDESQCQMYRYFEDLPPKARVKALAKTPLILAKTSTISTVHRRLYTDSIEIKRFDKRGKIIGMRRFIGLYGSTAYYSSIRNTPLLRAKAAAILSKFGYPRNGYAAKTLMLILESLPRNDFIEADVEELYEMAIGIYQLHGRRFTKLFVREDTYRRYVSCLVYLPRDNFNTGLRLRIQDRLLQAFSGHAASFDIQFNESILARLHFIIRIDSKQPLKYNLAALEQDVVAISYSWQDALQDQLREQCANESQVAALFTKYQTAFPVGYCDTFVAEHAVQDIELIEKLQADQSLGMSVHNPATDGSNSIQLKLFNLSDTILLSEALPILENLGFKVISEQAYKITPMNSGAVWISDFLLQAPIDPALIVTNQDNFYQAFNKIWCHEAENDGFNKLVLAANLCWREVTVLRGLAKYLHQIRFPFSQQSIESALAKNLTIASLLINLWHERFDPAKHVKNNVNKIKALEKEVLQKLEKVVNLEEDRILRQLLAVIKAVVRTNFYQNKPCLSFKLSCREVPELPLPRPLFEIFVYAPTFEGVHLRMAKVARGGLRWSDRREDFRTEILGLMKAQQVKNVVIVPNGAKGGFVLKQLPANLSRADFQRIGVECYKTFVRGLLDITDNIVNNKIVPPKDVVRHDPDDPYLVVAADKGTATFSDIANSISKEYGFWLYDAFASGGSTGYDHKAIGITARGGWESVKYCFAERGMDSQKQDFTAVGVGDMAGDVFGNGMLLSPHLKLIGAFNHMHIFLDPNPDPKASFAERKRLFKLPQSTWEDYNSKLISAGGGVFKRSAKSIPLSKQIRAALDITAESLTPNELIRAILRAPVDLLWNGGIGTYVKATTESHADIGDRNNDVLRIDATELRCKMVAEGGNLGFSQLARIEYSLRGGVINTDFIDNSGGVDCSDHEVNIKILLNSVVRQGKMSEKERNVLLAQMTDEVADLVLYNNYRQARAISAQVAYSKTAMDAFMRCIRLWESTGKLNRALEFLPNDKILEERKANSEGLTRPEIAILLAYAKLILKEEILSSSLPDNPYYFKYLNKLFPARLAKKFAKAMVAHRLRREIITTQLTNDLITNMGLTFVQQIKDETNASTIDVVSAYVAASDIFAFESILSEVEQLDTVVSPKVQQEMVAQAKSLVGHAVRWLVKNKKAPFDTAELVNQYGPAVAKLRNNIATLIHAAKQLDFATQLQQLTQNSVPKTLSTQIVGTRILTAALDIVEMAAAFKAELLDVAKTYFAMVAGK